MSENPLANQTKPALVESKRDLRAVQVLISRVRGLPIPVIQQTFRISRATVYEDLARAREIFGLDRDQLIPNLVLLSEDLIRQSYGQLGDLDTQLGEDGKPLSAVRKNAMKSAILDQIDRYISTQRENIKLLTGQGQIPQQQTNVQVNFPAPPPAVYNSPEATYQEIIEGLKKAGKIHPKPVNMSTETAAS